MASGLEAALEAASGAAQRAHHGVRPFRKAARRDTGCAAGAISRRGAAGERRTATRGSSRHSAGRGKSPRCHAGASYSGRDYATPGRGSTFTMVLPKWGHKN